MAFFISSSPHVHTQRSTQDVMKWVTIAAIPGLITQSVCFGWGTLIQLGLAILIAILLEGITMLLRKRSPRATLKDNSALVSAWLLAVAIPPLSPWWIITLGLFFAIIVAKQLYGGLGQNPFNPAMVGYVVLLIAFPVQMTSWLPPQSLSAEPTSFMDSLSTIFSEFSTNGLSVQQLRMSIDGMTMATPLDAVKTGLHSGMSLSDILALSPFGLLAGIGWEWVNLAYLFGGILLLKQRIIQWHIPLSLLCGMVMFSALVYLLPGEHASPTIHLFSGATMLGAFFIATDPVTASTTVKGRLIFGTFIGVMIVIIRTWGGFPDGVAFSVLLANMCVPLIDHYTQPKTYGHNS